MKKIWIAGSKGQLGTEIQLQHDILKNVEYHFTDIQEFDLTDKEAVNDFARKIIPDLIVNCAAYTAVDKAESEEDTALKLNRDIPANLAAVADHYSAILIHVSTDYVFDGSSNYPYRETDCVNPVSAYGRTKLAGEECVLSGKKNMVIRTSWLYSAHGNNFVKTMLRLGKERESIGVVFDQVGCPTHAADLAGAILHIIEKIINSDTKYSSVYHYSNEGVCSWYDFAVSIMKLARLSCKVKPITTDQYPLPAKRPVYSVFDKSKIKTDFGLMIPHWEESLEKVIRKLVP